MSITFSNRSKEAFALALDLHKNQKRKIAKGVSENLAVFHNSLDKCLC